MKSSQNDHQNPSGTHISSIQRPMAKYNRLSNTVRQITPGPWQCAMFCGGKNCKYDNPAKWSDSEMALRGLYSSWVGDSILAIARPSSEAIEKYGIVEQFKEHGINSIINLQRPGEHSSCGNPLQSSGFAYQPEQFMDNDIFFFNFGWDDYGVRSLPSILDMVKVMSFALKEGKVAVHCHAGLGRTGVLIACYLIYEQRMEGDNAIQFVRAKRKGSIQTPGQIECCQQFAKFLIPIRVIFSSCDPCAYPFTLDQFLIRQKLMLHGYEARELKHIPKIVRAVCSQLARLASCVSTPQPKQRKENIDILKKTAPGAFPSQRELQNPRLSPRDKHLSAVGYDSLTQQNKLPPLKKSCSAEDLSRDAAGYGSQASLGVPQTKQMPRRSPVLDMRRNVTDGNLASSSDDDHSAIVETSGLAALRNARYVNRSKAQTPKRTPKGKLTSGLNRSVSMLAALLIDDLQAMDDVRLVGTAMAFDAASSNVDLDELNQVLTSLQLRVESLQHNLNRSTTAWEIVSTEGDPFVLSMLMWSWLEHLKEPILSKADVKKLESEYDEEDPAVAFKNLNRGVKQTLDCILKTVAKLPLQQPPAEDLEDSILVRFIKAATHISVVHLPSEDGSIKKRWVDGEYESDESLTNLLIMLRAYVRFLRMSGADDTLSLSSQNSSLVSLNDSRSMSLGSRETRGAPPSRFQAAPPTEPTRGATLRDPKQSEQARETSASPELMRGVRESNITSKKSPRDRAESDTLPSPSGMLPRGLQRRKLKAIETKKAENSEPLTTLPKKNALPPIF
ncbi:protein tyrosine phosphatase domain-containing protein 1-like [Patiria miniata]|uniref:Protein tyrosine phosphatase domain-containing protein 1 n=1 Tax=Patiria miniata TaxID=46514 RepID=A0A913Z9R1_PATMI|nr:protein tyrosine phosphatase domain-containing protein 1-like [Patiria miniata]